MTTLDQTSLTFRRNTDSAAPADGDQRGSAQEADIGDCRLVIGTGAVFLALLGIFFVLGNLVPSSGYPSPFGSAAQINSFFIDNRATVRAQSVVLLLAGIALLGFTASLTEVLRRVTRRRDGLVRCAFGGGVLASGFAMISAIGLWTMTRPETAATTSVLRPLHDLTYLAGGPAHVLGIAVFVGAASAAMLGGNFRPRWVSNLGLATCAVSALGVIGMVWEPATYLVAASRPLFGAWILTVCVPMASARAATLMRLNRATA